MIKNVIGEDVNPYIIWEIITKCNFRCGYCSFEQKDGYSYLDSIKRGINTITSSVESPIIDFTGGEPSLHPSFCNILKYATEKSNSDVYVTTNATLDLKVLSDILKSIPYINRQKLGFYLTYHHKQTKLYQYTKYAEILNDYGVRVFVKFLCDPNDFDGIKDVYEKYISDIKYDKFFMKYRWDHHKEKVYSDEYYKWILDNSKSNDIYFNVEFEDGTHKKYYYDTLVYDDLNNFKGMYCNCIKLLYIDVIGRIYPSCLKHSLKSPIGNLYSLKNLNKIYENKDKKIKCIKEECTEIINNPNKWSIK
jgi:MoaA/NifB/PqqE/SkfB family radical SAM enzyme